MKPHPRPGPSWGAPRGVALVLFFGLAGWAGCASAPPPPEEAPPGAPPGIEAEVEACATILSTNDSHGRLHPETPAFANGREVGGVAALGGWFARFRTEAEREGCPVFLLSGGDIMQGTLISNLVDGESMIAAFNALGYDAAAIGNHEFDWGIEILTERMAQAEFPLLGANIYVAGTDRHPEWAVPWTIVEREGVRVGVIGAATRETPWTTRPSNVEGLEFRPIAEALDRYIPELRARGVHFVVVTMHAGGFCDDGSCEGEAIRELGRTREPFDYAVTGHTHSRLETGIRGHPVIQSFANTTAFGVGRLERPGDGSRRARIVGIRTAWSDSVAPDSALVEIVERYEAIVAERAERVVATLAEPLEDPQRAPAPLGRLIADAQRAATGAQAAIMNNGGIRRGLPAGPVTYGQLFEVQPFQNTLVVLELRGSTLLAALDHAVEPEGPDAQISGLRVTYVASAPDGSQVVSARLADGTPIVRDGTYTVAVNDFMVAGGSGFTMFERAEASRVTGILDLDALVTHLRALPQPVQPPHDVRWIPADTRASRRTDEITIPPFPPYPSFRARSTMASAPKEPARLRVSSFGLAEK